MSQNHQNMQNKRWGGSTTVSPLESRRLAGFHNQEKGFDGFAGFVIKTNRSANRGTSALCATCGDGLTVQPFPVRLLEVWCTNLRLFHWEKAS